ncbi:MAG TPA: O-antigen ligase family protein [Baekduia sp.]|nr:O-antigen ligase family protein [Baekduia sp.]
MSDPRAVGDRALTGLVLLSPAVLMAVLAFRSGGYFPDWSATATIAVLLLLTLRATLARRPFDGLTRGLAAGAVLLAAFVVWVLVSGSWSGSWARSLLEYSRDVGYLAMLVLCGLLARSSGRARVLVLGLAAAGVVVGVAALAVWLRPDRFPVGPGFARDRLSWPLSYWNATGLLAALTAVWCLHLSSADRSRALRVAATAAVPLLAAVVWFSVSRGAAAAGAIGVAVYLLAGPSRGLLTGVPACAAAATAGVLVAAGASGLNRVAVDDTGLAEGRHAAVLLVAVAAGAALLRAALLPVDGRLARVRLGPAFRRRAWATVGVAAAAAVVLGLSLGGVDRTRAAYDHLVNDASVSETLAPGQRFTELSANGRIEHWRVAIDLGFVPHRLHGSGAGTFEVLWTRGRDATFPKTVVDAHSLYVEVLGELGLVGLVLIVAALLCGLVALARRTREAGPVWAALLATSAAWAIHAGIDWDWEMPALTYPVMAAAGLALGAPVARRRAGDPDAEASHGAAMPVRVGLGLGCLLLAVLPFNVMQSQHRLADAVRAFRAGDCRQAVDRALASSAALGVRPEPFEVLAWCDLRLGNPTLADRAVAAAIRRDPENWQPRYDQALVRATTGRDPRAAFAAARARNPHGGVLAQAEPWLGRHHSARGWRRFALHAPLPLQ